MKQDAVKFGLGSWVGSIAAAAAALMPLIGDLSNAAEPLGVDPKVWLIISAALLVITVVGRMRQAAAKAGRIAIGNVAVGPSTIIGYAAAAAAAIIPMIGELADAAAPLGIPPTFWFIASAVLTGVVNLGRMEQAVKLAKDATLNVDAAESDPDNEDLGSATDEITPGVEV